MSMAGYTKLFGSIIHSTIWRAPDHVRLVWITMLAMADKHGEVEASVPGLADAARVTIEQCDEALEALSSPDLRSRNKENEGRRIEKIKGGWRLLNHGHYRAKLSAEERRAAERERKARWRAKVRAESQNVPDKSHVPAPEAESKAEADPPEGAGGELLTELRTHPVLRFCDHERMAEQILGFQIGTGKPLEWHLDAIRWVAAQATGAELAGQPWPDAKIGEKLLTVCRSPSKPRGQEQEESQGDRSEAEHKRKKAAFAKSVAELRAKLAAEGKELHEP